MVTAVLSLLRDEKTFSQYELAERLGISPETVSAVIDFLSRTGRLKKTCINKATCGKRCAGCHLQENAHHSSFILWELEK